MKKRLGTVLLLALFVISSMMPTSAATAEIWNEARASHYFDAYMLGISAKGGGEMAVSFGVFGTDTMDKIGVYSLRIESEIAPNKWIEEFTVYGSSDPDTFYAMDTIQHGGDFYFDGMPGVKYRAVMVAYAKNASGYEYSKLYISNLYLISKLVSAQKTESRSIPLLSVLIFIWENKVH